MKRKIVAFGNYYREFIDSLNDKERQKVHYILSKALKIKDEYYASKQQPTDGH